VGEGKKIEKSDYAKQWVRIAERSGKKGKKRGKTGPCHLFPVHRSFRGSAGIARAWDFVSRKNGDEHRWKKKQIQGKPGGGRDEGRTDAKEVYGKVERKQSVKIGCARKKGIKLFATKTVAQTIKENNQASAAVRN